MGPERGQNEGLGTHRVSQHHILVLLVEDGERDVGRLAADTPHFEGHVHFLLEVVQHLQQKTFGLW